MSAGKENKKVCIADDENNEIMGEIQQVKV